MGVHTFRTLEAVQKIMKLKATKRECKRCGGTGFIEVCPDELGFTVLTSCPECDLREAETLRELLEG